MASRIPKPKPPTSSRTTPQQLTLDDLHTSLASLGAPQITKEELGRLYQGSLGNALAFVVGRVKGRNGCAVARELIHKRTGSTRSALDKAASRVSGAKKGMEVIRGQLDERKGVLDAVEHEVTRLQTTLTAKRRVNLLLDVLERKEGVRKKRFDEIGGLLDGLRRKIQEPSTQKPLILLDEIPQAAKTPSNTILRTSHTRDTLTAMHAHHIRLSKIVQRGARDVDAESRLRRIVARTLGALGEDKRVGSYVDKCIMLARLRAREKVQFRRTIAGPVVRPGDVVQVTRAKQKELQDLSDRTVALEFLCDHFVKTISTFTKTTTQTLRSSLEEESVDTKGYVSVLQWLVCNSTRGFEGGEWEREVGGVLGIMGNVTPKGVMREVERAIQRAYRRESFLKKVSLSHPPIPEEQQSLIAEYKRTSEAAHESAVRLLRRKAEKVEMGNRVVRDVGVIVGEGALLVGLSG